MDYAKEDVTYRSRQLGIVKNQSALSSSTVLICGLGPLAWEVVKNLALIGIGNITIEDNGELVTATDERYGLSENLAKPIIGQSRAISLRSLVVTLNPSCRVIITDQATCADFLKKANISVRPIMKATLKFVRLTRGSTALAQVVIALHQDSQKLALLNDQCREASVKLIVGDAFANAGVVFTDFGPTHAYQDAEGRNPASDNATKKIRSVTKIQNGDLKIQTWEKLREFKEGDHIVIHSCDVLPAQFQQVTLTPKSFSTQELIVSTLGDWELIDSSKGDVVRHGYVVRHPKTVSVTNKSFSSFTPYSSSGIADQIPLENRNSSAVTFLAYQAFRSGLVKESPNIQQDIQNIIKSYEGRLPALRNNAKFQENAALEAMVKAALKGDTWAPMLSLVGGTVVSETIKALTCVYRPASQFLCMSMASGCDVSEASPVYERLKRMKVLVVGAGAIGCEVLKMLAQLGVGTAPEGLVAVADLDHVDVSNLHRQFLFRESDTKSPKSVAACRAIKQIRPEMNIDPYTAEVSDSHYDIYTPDFWSSIDVVLAAVDSGAAREYLCNQARFYGVPAFLECGTDGMFSSASCCLPGRAGGTYTAVAPIDMDLQDTNSCSPKMFPFHTNHAIRWAAEIFDEVFVNWIASYKEHLKSSESTSRGLLDRMALFERDIVPKEFVKYVYDKYFIRDVEELLREHPADSMEGEALFWSGLRHKPLVMETFDPENVLDHKELLGAFMPLLEQLEQQKQNGDKLEKIEFEKDDETHLLLVRALSQLRCKTFSLPVEKDLVAIQRVAGNVAPAIVTTTAAISAFCVAQLFSVAANSPPMNINYDLAQSSWLAYGISLRTDYPAAFPRGVIDHTANLTDTLDSIRFAVAPAAVTHLVRAMSEPDLLEALGMIPQAPESLLAKLEDGANVFYEAISDEVDLMSLLFYVSNGAPQYSRAVLDCYKQQVLPMARATLAELLPQSRDALTLRAVVHKKVVREFGFVHEPDCPQKEDYATGCTCTFEFFIRAARLQGRTVLKLECVCLGDDKLSIMIKLNIQE